VTGLVVGQHFAEVTCVHLLTDVTSNSKRVNAGFKSQRNTVKTDGDGGAQTDRGRTVLCCELFNRQ